jgi:hypothetical protein
VTRRVQTRPLWRRSVRVRGAMSMRQKDCGADDGGVSDGDGVEGGFGCEGVEPFCDAGDEAGDGFAVVRGGGGISQPLGDGL